MKRYRIIAIIYTLLMGLQAHAETEVYASVGFFPQGRIVAPTEYFWSSERPAPGAVVDFRNSDWDVYGDNIKRNTTITVGAMHTIFSRFSVGLQYNGYKAKAYSLPDANEIFVYPVPEVIKNRSALYSDWYIHNVMAVAKYSWLKINRWNFYSKAGVGVRIKTSKTKVLLSNLNLTILPDSEKTSCAYEVLPLGIDYRFWGPLSLYAEGGYGTTACLSTGLRATF